MRDLDQEVRARLRAHLGEMVADGVSADGASDTLELPSVPFVTARPRDDAEPADPPPSSRAPRSAGSTSSVSVLWSASRWPVILASSARTALIASLPLIRSAPVAFRPRRRSPRGRRRRRACAGSAPGPPGCCVPRSWRAPAQQAVGRDRLHQRVVGGVREWANGQRHRGVGRRVVHQVRHLGRHHGLQERHPLRGPGLHLPGQSAASPSS